MEMKNVCFAGNGNIYKPPPTDISLSEIFASIQRSKLGIQDWSLSDLTVGLYLIYLQQASTGATEDVKGELISSEAIVIIKTIFVFGIIKLSLTIFFIQ